MDQGQLDEYNAAMVRGSALMSKATAIVEQPYFEAMFKSHDLMAAMLKAGTQRPEKLGTISSLVFDPEVLYLVAALILAQYNDVQAELLLAQMDN